MSWPPNGWIDLELQPPLMRPERCKDNYHQSSTTTINNQRVPNHSQPLTGKLMKNLSTLPILSTKSERSMTNSWRLSTKSTEPSQDAAAGPSWWSNWTRPCSTTTSCGWPTTWCTWSRLRHSTTSETQPSWACLKWPSSSQELTPLAQPRQRLVTSLLKTMLSTPFQWGLPLSSLGAPGTAHHSLTQTTTSHQWLPPLPSLVSDSFGSKSKQK